MRESPAIQGGGAEGPRSADLRAMCRIAIHAYCIALRGCRGLWPRQSEIQRVEDPRRLTVTDRYEWGREKRGVLLDPTLCASLAYKSDQEPAIARSPRRGEADFVGSHHP